MTVSTDHAYSAGWGQDAQDEPGGRMVATDGRALPLQGARLHADACAGQCRVVLQQWFHNPHPEPLEVRYRLPLPADGAVSGFAFTIDGRRIVGQIDRKQVARARYERALAEGRSAALLEQERSSLFTQKVGNIPPGATVVAEVTIDQPLQWIDSPSFGGWEWRFPTVVGPRFMGARGRVPDASRVSVPVADGPLRAGVELELRVRDSVVAGAGALPSSPSHQLDVRREGPALRVGLAQGSAALDRDVVVRWAVARPRPGVELDVGRAPAGHAWGHAAFGVLTLIPPGAGYQGTSVSRDMIILIDTSGSMHGEPLDQAKRVATALIESLERHDRLELIEFSSRPRRWRRGAARLGDRGARRDALDWVRALRASGGTYMRDGIIEALRPLDGESLRQVVLITDGLIGFEDEIVAAVKRRPARTRVHTVGIGNGVNRALTRPVAREGAGVELILAPGQDVEPALKTLLERSARPRVVNLQIEGAAGLAPERLPDLYAGAPTKIGLCLDAGGGRIVLRGRTAEGAWTQTLEYAPIASGDGNQAAAVMYAREWVEDLESRRLAGEPPVAIEEEIERVGLQFSIATRKTSWVAVSEQRDVDSWTPRRRVDQPHELPAGMNASMLGLRPAAAPVPGAMPAPAPRGRAAPRAAMRPSATPISRAAPPQAPPSPPMPSPMPALPPEPEPTWAGGDGFADEGGAPPASGSVLYSLDSAPPPAAPQQNLVSFDGPVELEADADEFTDGLVAAGEKRRALVSESVLDADAEESDEDVKETFEEAKGAKLEQPSRLSGAPMPAPSSPPSRAAELPSFSSMDDGGEGFLSRVGKRIGRMFGRREAPGLIQLVGQIVERSAGHLVIIASTTGALRWAPGATATLRLADGRLLTVRVDAAGSSPSGAYSTGQTLRVRLLLPDARSVAAAALELESESGERCIITL